MNDNSTPSGSEPSEPQPLGDNGQFTQKLRFQHVSARVPEDVSPGLFATGALVINGPHEFVVDFIQAVTRPQQVAARVVLPPTIMASVIRALKQNIENHTARFGPMTELPKPPPNAKPPSIEEIYEQLKLPDEVAAGIYANTVMITHSVTEFCFDFITSFYPRSTVATRIYMAAPQVQRVLETLSRSYEQYQRKLASAAQAQAQQQLQSPSLPPLAFPPPPPVPPAPPTPPDSNPPIV